MLHHYEEAAVLHAVVSERLVIIDEDLSLANELELVGRHTVLRLNLLLCLGYLNKVLTITRFIIPLQSPRPLEATACPVESSK